MATIDARELDLTILEHLKRHAVRDEGSSGTVGSLHVPSGPPDTAVTRQPPRSANPPETRADELVIMLDANTLRVCLNAVEAWILANRSPLADEEDHRERARKIREGLAGRAQSDSGAIQHEDRQR
jgi:hypothetical protein